MQVNATHVSLHRRTIAPELYLSNLNEYQQLRHSLGQATYYYIYFNLIVIVFLNGVLNLTIIMIVTIIYIKELAMCTV